MSYLMQENESLATCFMLLKHLILLEVSLPLSLLNLFGARWFGLKSGVNDC